MAYNPKSQQGIARQLTTGYMNGEAFTLLKGQPVSVNSSGQMVAVNISNEASASAIVGVCVADTVSGANGQVMDIGRLENITTSFSIRDTVYVGVDGQLTTTKPEVGVGSFVTGNFVIFIGIIVKNEFNPSQKDLKVFIDIVGQL